MHDDVSTCMHANFHIYKHCACLLDGVHASKYITITCLTSSSSCLLSLSLICSTSWAHSSFSLSSIDRKVEGYTVSDRGFNCTSTSVCKGEESAQRRIVSALRGIELLASSVFELRWYRWCCRSDPKWQSRTFPVQAQGRSKHWRSGQAKRSRKVCERSERKNFLP